MKKVFKSLIALTLLSTASMAQSASINGVVALDLGQDGVYRASQKHVLLRGKSYKADFSIFANGLDAYVNLTPITNGAIIPKSTTGETVIQATIVYNVLNIPHGLASGHMYDANFSYSHTEPTGTLVYTFLGAAAVPNICSSSSDYLKSVGCP